VIVVFVVGMVFDIVAHLRTDVVGDAVGIDVVVVVGVGTIEADIADFVVVAGVAVVVGVVAMLGDRRRNLVGQRRQRRFLPPGWEIQRRLHSD